MAVIFHSILFILILHGVSLGQCDSVLCKKDSVIRSLDSLSRFQAKEIGSLFAINNAERLRYEDLIRTKQQTDTLYAQRIEMLRWYLEQNESKKTLSLGLGILSGVIIALTTILIINR